MSGTPPRLISDDALNRLYGHLGRTFKTRAAAETAAQDLEQPHWIYPIWDGRNGSRERVGYLLSLAPPPPPPPRFTGKVRSE